MHCICYCAQGIRKIAQKIKKFNDSPHVLYRGGYELMERKFMDEKMKTRQNQAEFTENTPMVVEPSSPIVRHIKWKMARTNKYGQMTSEAAQQISDKTVSGIKALVANLIDTWYIIQHFTDFWLFVTG